MIVCEKQRGCCKAQNCHAVPIAIGIISASLKWLILLGTDSETSLE